MRRGAYLQLEGLAGTSDDGALFRALAARQIPLREVEDRLIDETLRATGGDKEEAARLLGISRRTIYRRGTGASAIDPDTTA